MTETWSAGALLVAAGTSQRMGFDKMTVPLCGRPLVEWSLKAFDACPDISYGVLVCSPNRVEEFSVLAAAYGKFQLVVAGGDQRADSVLNGLDALHDFSPTAVVVHDAARPLVTPALISSVVSVALEHGAAVAAEPVSDTLHRAEGGILIETISRKNVWRMQTPQAARFHELHNALQSARENGLDVTDEISALLAIGMRPRIVAHDALNFKVTYPRDLQLAATILGGDVQSTLK